MNILVIGNGFDLAHELPTKYVHFLDFVKVIKQIINYNDSNNVKIDWDDLDSRIVDQIISNMRSVSLFEKKWKDLLDNNVWIDYFLQCDSFLKENWVDFEKEICRIIKLIDEDMHKNRGDSSVVKNISESFFEDYLLDDLDKRMNIRDEEAFAECAGLPIGEQEEYVEKYRQDNPVLPLKDKITYNELIIRLESDLNKLIRALEIYLSECVGNLNCEKISPDIINIIGNKEKDSLKVISFNYSNTYERVYLNQYLLPKWIFRLNSAPFSEIQST